MKKQIAIASAILAASSYSFAEIALTESLSVEGFVDMSYSDDGKGTSAIGVDQVEFDFLFSAGIVNAQVDLQSAGSGNTEIEQAFVSYDLGNGGALTAGLFASQLGFDAVEPTGLYQYSTAYGSAVDYDTGLKYTNGGLGVAVVNGASGNAVDGDDYIIELAYSRELAEGINGFIGYRSTQLDAGDQNILNAYVTYETGAWLFAAEVVDDDNAGTTDYMVMANYTLNDSDSITARYVDEEGEGSSVTVAYLTALADNLALVAEVKQTSEDVTNEDVTSSAVELLFTF